MDMNVYDYLQMKNTDFKSILLLCGMHITFQLQWKN